MSGKMSSYCCNFIIFFALICIFTESSCSSQKLSPDLHKALNSRTQTSFDIIISLKSGSFLKSNNGAKQRSLNLPQSKRVSELVGHLRNHTQTTQSNLLSLILKRRTGFSSVDQLWISNELFVRGASSDLIKELAENSDVSFMREQVVIQIQPQGVTPYQDEGEIGEDVLSWGVEKIGSKSWWNANYTGKGVVVGHIDTGVRISHESLFGNYLGNYGWFDPHSGIGVPYESDNATHGTHILATAVGSKGVGVAPGAKWMSCMGCPGVCEENLLKKCALFMLCPRWNDFQDNNNCGTVPNVVLCSWGTSIGGNQFFDFEIAAWKEAGIIPVFAAGDNANANRRCESLSSPGDHPSVISVGASNNMDKLAPFSSAGPSLREKSGWKPDLVAPGLNVWSAISYGDNLYGFMNGSSVAAAHVVGAIAIFLSKNPHLSFTEVQTVLHTTAKRDFLDVIGDGRHCDGYEDTDLPNHAFGYGRLDIDEEKAGPLIPPSKGGNGAKGIHNNFLGTCFLLIILMCIL